MLECIFYLYTIIFYSNSIFIWLQEGYTLAVMHIGAPACGMNAAVRSFVRNCIYRGDTVYGIHDGVEGLVAGNVSGNFVYFLFQEECK